MATALRCNKVSSAHLMPMCMCDKQQLQAGVPRSALIITVTACLAACCEPESQVYEGHIPRWADKSARNIGSLTLPTAKFLHTSSAKFVEPLGGQAHVGFHESSPEKEAAATLMTAVLQRLRHTGCSSKLLTAESGSVTAYLWHVSR